MDNLLFEKIKDNIIERDLEFKVHPSASKITDLTDEQKLQILDLMFDYFSNPKDRSTLREVMSTAFLYTHDIIEATDAHNISGMMYKKSFENIVKIYNIKIKTRYNYLLDESNPVCIPWNSNVYSWDYIDESKLKHFNTLDDCKIKELEKIIDENINAFLSDYRYVTSEMHINDRQKPVKALNIALTMLFPFSDEFIYKHRFKIIPWFLLENEKFMKTFKEPEVVRSILGDSMTYFMNEVLDRTTFGQLKNVFKTEQSVVDAAALLLFIK